MNPEGISSSSPGLAFFSQPWGEEIKFATLKRVVSVLNIP
jgi:hypothetical protein